MDLIEQYQQLHREGKFTGASLVPHIPAIKQTIKRFNCRTLLDYGCGKAEFHPDWGIPATLYDPGVPIFDTKPQGLFDLVICTDVLEHLEEDQVSDVLDEIFGYATRAVFLTICTRPAKKKLPDGRNCHLTVQPREWWSSVIGPRAVPYEVKWNV